MMVRRHNLRLKAGICLNLAACLRGTSFAYRSARFVYDNVLLVVKASAPIMAHLKILVNT